MPRYHASHMRPAQSQVSPYPKSWVIWTSVSPENPDLTLSETRVLGGLKIERKCVLRCVNHVCSTPFTDCPSQSTTDDCTVTVDGCFTSLPPGMWVSRPGLGFETDQDHFFEVLVLVLVSTLLVLVLVLVLVSEGGLEQDLRLCVC